mmetsp:Transcript_1910/g.6332  ORF Transcript_1910/g.6332 Transcript_1910/m.6332 type:complete len:232 (-) Transcript_1910:312-1007(-)
MARTESPTPVAAGGARGGAPGEPAADVAVAHHLEGGDEGEHDGSDAPPERRCEGEGQLGLERARGHEREEEERDRHAHADGASNDRVGEIALELHAALGDDERRGNELDAAPEDLHEERAAHIRRGRRTLRGRLDLVERLLQVVRALQAQLHCRHRGDERGEVAVARDEEGPLEGEHRGAHGPPEEEELNGAKWATGEWVSRRRSDAMALRRARRAPARHMEASPRRGPRS